MGLTRGSGTDDRTVWTVTAVITGEDRSFAAADPAISYAQALAAYITAALE